MRVIRNTGRTETAEMKVPEGAKGWAEIAKHLMTQVVIRAAVLVMPNGSQTCNMSSPV